MNNPQIPPEETTLSDPSTIDDDDSGFDEMSNVSDMASLSASIFDYRRIHGRTYQREYHLPNDHKQLESFDLAHHWMTLLLDDKLCLAPVEKPRKVLDIGTGTGIWAIDFSDMNPSSEVVGTDISPTQPTWVPPNCRFVIEDCEQPWTWDEDHFDFVHVRHMVGAIADWRKLYQQVFTHTRPGGWFQHADMDIQTMSDTGLVGQDHVFNKWCDLHFQAAEKAGRSLKWPVENGGMKALMEETGFVDVVQHTFRIPIGGWMLDQKMRTVGMFALEYLTQALEGFAIRPLSEMIGWDLKAIEGIQAVMLKALRRTRLQPYFTVYLTYGRKPN